MLHIIRRKNAKLTQNRIKGQSLVGAFLRYNIVT